MGNLGAFITMNGEQLKPNFTTYEAKVHNQYYLMFFFLASLVLSFFRFKCFSPIRKVMQYTYI